MGKAIVTPRFGERLKQERARRHWSLGQVVSRVHRASAVLDGFAASQLLHYEAGHVKMPDPIALSCLADVYGLDVAVLIQALAEDRQAMDESPPAGQTPVRGKHARAR